MSDQFIKSLPLPIAIVGLGRSGCATKNLLSSLLEKGSFVTYDDTDPTAEYSDSEKLLACAAPKTLVVSPGYPLARPWIQGAIKSGVRLTSELEIAKSLFKNERLIGVSGSIGKSTTVSILQFGLAAAQFKSFVGGNLGIPLAEYSLSVLMGAAPADWVVLELSSYQLENFNNLKCVVSALTFFTPNHLERYADLQAYYETKWSLFSKTESVRVANQTSPDLLSFSKSQRLSVLWTNQHDPKNLHYNFSSSPLIGGHNFDNLSMALRVGEAAGWSSAVLEKMVGFVGLPHRLENCGIHSGITFINDSKATTMESVLIAVSSVLERFQNRNTLFVLLGGRDKKLPWHELERLKNTAGVSFVFFGEAGLHAKKNSKLSGPNFLKLKEALSFLKTIAVVGDVVLLSPGGVSQDEFKNFEERGEFFKNQIEKLWS